MIKAVLFDFDGTLTPLTLDFDLLRHEIETIALSFVDSTVIEACRDRYILEMIYAVADHIGNAGFTFRHEALKKLTELELGAARGKQLFPYSGNVFEALKKMHIKTGIITRTSIAIIEEVFPHYQRYISTIVAREHTVHFKPDPRHLSRAASEMSLSSEHVLMVGDHPTDIAVGKSAGALTAGVLTGRTRTESFEAAGADYIIADIRGIVPIIAQSTRG